MTGSAVTDDPDAMGCGFELTMRIPADRGQPPAWSLRLLQQLGRYLYSGQLRSRAGHRQQPGGPITGTPHSQLTALAFADDPQVHGIDGRYGRLLFLTVVGITADELGRMNANSTSQVLAELAALSLLMVSDVVRRPKTSAAPGSAKRPWHRTVRLRRTLLQRTVCTR